jgi:hypothetical protein
MEQRIDIEGAIRDYHSLVRTSREVYDTIQEINCPYFKSNISLTSDGFNHLLNKPNRQPRNIKEQRLKLRLLKPALNLLSKAGTVQEYRTTLEKWGEPRKDGFSKTKQVEYWGFHDIIGNEVMVLIRVIVRKVGDGKHHFWSVMPIGKIGKQKFYRDDMWD